MRYIGNPQPETDKFVNIVTDETMKFAEFINTINKLNSEGSTIIEHL